MLAAKAVVAALFSGVCAAGMVIGAIVVARLVAKPLVGSQLSLTEPAVWRMVGAIALYAVLAAVLGVGVGALLRVAAGAVAVLLLWPLVVEPMLGNLPSVGTEVARTCRSRMRSCSPGCRGCFRRTPCRGENSVRWCISPRSSRWCSSRRSWW